MFFDKGQCCYKNPYCVLSFSKENFYHIIEKSTLATLECIDSKAQLYYIFHYAERIGAKTIVVEGNYIDKSYLEDYSAYYVKCFKKYQREVNKVHFFKNEFTKDGFDNILNTNDQTEIKELKDSYIGFTTIKKLPYTFIGKTCLKSLDAVAGRHFATLRKYEVNLFGIELEIEALAYQEQDSTVCACATSALWSIFHSTGKLFQHRIPSPVEITKIATDQASSETRIFPNKGLNLKMIAQGIKNIGLEPYKIEIHDINTLKASIYAYLKANIPMLMGFALQRKITKQLPTDYHAVAVIGYNMPEAEIESNNSFKLKAFSIDKIYVHDDQVGPYAKMVMLNGADNLNPILSTSFGKNVQTGEEPYISVPFALSIPLYKNIRIPFDSIFVNAINFNKFIKFFLDKFGNKCNFEWDIYLQSSKQLKSSILNYEYNIINNPADILTRSLPSYVWCCDIISNKNIVLKVLFDATDIETNLNIIDVVKYKNYNENSFYDIFVFTCRYIYEAYPDTRSNAFISGFSSMANYEAHSSKVTVALNK